MPGATRGTLACLCACVALAVLGAGAVEGATIDVPGDYPTIQAAIDAASANDEIVVAPNTYSERINFKGKAITVRSTAPTNPAVVAATIIDGGAAGTVVTFNQSEGAGSVLEGFTITNGNGSYGGGIACWGASPTIRHNVITGNTANYGGGVGWRNDNCQPTVSDNAITGNVATGGVDNQGGGIYCDTGCSGTISGNKITGNAANNPFGTGGGIQCREGSSPTISGNTITGNVAGQSGGGIQCSYDAATVSGNTIGGNTAGVLRDGWGGGIYCRQSSGAITGNTVSGNTALGFSVSTGGGGICCDPGTSATISNNRIANNTTVGPWAFGGGIVCTDSGAVFSGNLISGNTAAGSGNGAAGGGVYCQGSASPTISGNVISGNGADGTRAYGGGICCDAPATVRNTIVCFSTSGGGIYVSGGSPSVSYCDVYGNSGGNYVGLTDLTGTNGNMSADPLFADAASGDFHLKSRGGRWDPLTPGWVIDTVHSPCIDTGDPASPWANEPAPNFSRVNIGAYGNTAEASKWANRSPTLEWVGTAPFLADGIDPDVGEADSTEFTFGVKVTDPEDTAPGRMFVRLQRLEDCREWTTVTMLPLQAISGTWASGMICEAKSALPNGSYRYDFHARDDAGSQATGEPAVRRSGPMIAGVPQLWCTGLPGQGSGLLTPETGTAFKTRFRFAVQCTDGQGTLPTMARIEVQRKHSDGGWRAHRTAEMRAWGGSPRTGKHYVWHQRLRPGEYRYRFVFEDDGGPATGSDSRYADATQWQAGPVVSEATTERAAGAGGAMVTSLAVIPAPAGAQIVFSLSAPMTVDARMLSIAGHPIKTLCQAKDCEAGTNRLLWNAQSDTGLPVPNGTYLVEVMARAQDGTRARALTQVATNR